MQRYRAPRQQLSGVRYRTRAARTGYQRQKEIQKGRKQYDFIFWTLIQIFDQRASFLINIFYTENYL